MTLQPQTCLHEMTTHITVGVLALQGAFIEHINLLRQASEQLPLQENLAWHFIEVRTPDELGHCDALIIPGGESTTVSLVAARSNLLEPLRKFVKYKLNSLAAFIYYCPSCGLFCVSRVDRKPTWGTCAGLILLAESANRTKKGGQDLIGGLDVRVNRNHFGRQTESFETELDLPFLFAADGSSRVRPFSGVFIRAPVVEKILPSVRGEQVDESTRDDAVIAPAQEKSHIDQPVEIIARLPGKSRTLAEKVASAGMEDAVGDIIAVRQGNVFGTSFHPELTQDARIHIWWLDQVRRAAQHWDQSKIS